MKYTYKTKFNLRHDVLDVAEANKYLQEYDMEQFFDKSKEYGVIKIEWRMINKNSGDIVVTTNRILNAKEKNILSDWILGQNSDGLGSGFEQAWFASYDSTDICDEYCTCEESEDEGDCKACYPDFYMCSFDWKSNKYVLELTPIHT